MSDSPKSPPTNISHESDVDEQISFVLPHPGMSAWLKDAFRDALERDPVATLNDLETLTFLQRSRCEPKIDNALFQPTVNSTKEQFE